MIDIRSGELTDLWPDETSPEYKSLSYALHMAIIRILDDAAGVGSTCDIDHLSEDTLDYMAVEMRAMYYDQSADIETKRRIIKGTLKWYTQAGTAASVGGMVAAIFGRGEATEWYDYGGDPGSFKIITGATLTEDTYAYLNRIIRKVKPARSRLDGVVISRENRLTEYAGTAARSHSKTVITSSSQE